MSPTKSWTPEDAEKGQKLLAEALGAIPTSPALDLGSLFNDDEVEAHEGTEPSHTEEEQSEPTAVIEEDGMDLQSVTETQDEIENQDEVLQETETSVEAAVEDNEKEPTEETHETEVESDISDAEIEYEISDEARERAIRAAEAQARVQQFLAQKAQRRLSAQSGTAKISNITKRQPCKLKKSAEEIQLEQALFAQAEWKVKFAQGKIRNESVASTKTKMKKEVKKQHQAKRRATIPTNVQVLNRKTFSRKVESAEEREAREIAEGKERLAKQLARNRKFRENGTKATELQCRAVHSTRPLTVPVTPKMMAGKVFGPKPTNESSHVSIADVDNYYKNMRRKSSAELSKAVQDAKSRPRITVPVAPNFATDQRMHKPSAPTKEEQELAIIAENQFKARPLKRSVFDGCGASGVPSVKSATPTVIEAFAIKGETNPAPRKEGTVSTSQEGSFKARPMPNYQQNPNAARRASSSKPLTIPTSPRISKSLSRQSMSSLDEKEMPQFTARPMPDYVAMRDSGINHKVKPRGVTVPTSPQISKGQPRQSISNEEEFKPFVARPVPDYNALSSSGINSHVKPRGPTIPVSPQISKGQPRQSISTEEPAPQFTARPIPDYGELSEVGINHKVKPRGVTIPTSPQISTSNRMKNSAPNDENTTPQFKARPVPDYNSMGRSSHVVARPVTVPEPFNMKGDAISQQKLAAKEMHREHEQMTEMEKRNFYAKPVPNQGACFTPRLSSKPLTQFEEFSIQSTGHKERVKQEIAEEQQLLEKARNFIARKMPESTFKPSFVPAPSDRPPLVSVENVCKNGENRVQERKAFDAAQKERLAQQEAMRIKMVQEREAEAEAEYKKRMEIPIEEGGLKFVARRVPRTTIDGPDFVPEPSSAELTAPVSPFVLRRPSGLKGGAVRVATA